MEEALRALLRGDSAVAAFVEARVDWGLRPQGQTVPAISLWRVAGGDGYTFDGPDGQTESVVQVDCWAADYSAAKRLARAVKALVSGQSAQGLTLFVRAERDGYEDDPASLLFRTSLDLTVWHTA